MCQSAGLFEVFGPPDPIRSDRGPLLPLYGVRFSPRPVLVSQAWLERQQP